MVGGDESNKRGKKIPVPAVHYQQQYIPVSAAQQQQYAPFPPHQPQAQVGSDVFVQILQMMQQQHREMMTQLIQQQQQSDEKHERFLRTIASSINVQVPPNPEQILDSLAGNIKEFRFEADSNVTFAAWYSRYDDLFEKDAARLDGEAKVRLLLRKLGASEHERYVSYILQKLPKNFSFLETVAKLKSLFGAKESVISRRYRCLQIAKNPAEDHVAFACRVNKACVEFELGKLSEEQFKCLVYVCGLKSENDVEIRTRLLTKIEERNDVTLEQLSKECQRLYNLKHDSAMIESPSTYDQVQSIRKFGGKRYEKRDRESPKHPSSDTDRKPNSPCWFCGGFHYVRDCRYKSHKCSECGQFGHREGYCASAKPRKTGRRRRKQPVSAKVVVVDVCSVQQRRRYVSVGFSGTKIRLQLDTASDITVISRKIWRSIGSPALSSATVNAKTASGSILSLDGEFECDVTIGSSTRRELIRVTEKQLQLLGSDLVDSFNFWAVPMDTFCCHVSGTPVSTGALKSSFPEVFSEKLGLCTRTKVKLELKENVRPVFCPKRPVAYAMYDTVDRELDRLEKLDIITPVDYSEWTTPIIVVRKSNSSIRICGDYSTGLNAALQSQQYPLPLPDDIFAKLAKCKIFSQIDLSDAFLQVEVDEQYRSLLTINTYRGLYLYNRLPPGLKITPGAFQQLIDTMLAGLKGTSGYLDDVIVGGETEEEHDLNLRGVLKRIQDFGFTIRVDKCSFRKQQIRYLGHIVDSRGLRPDPTKIEAITKLPPPADVSGVRSFLGAINYYGKFVPNMRMLRYPLDNLLRVETKFSWSPECQKAFDRFKQILSSDLLLTHYDPKREIIVSADASSVGLGATISHRFPDGTIKVVQHASRALTKAEQGYSQPDREGLAIIFAKEIPVYTANRLQRFALNLLLYDFEIEYVSTEKFGNADLLSRLIDQHIKPEEDYVIASLNLEEDIRVVAQSTQADPLLRQVHRYVQNGWPQSTLDGSELRRFQSRQESLSVVDGCILFAERLVIPSLHRKRFVKACQQCASAARSPPHSPPVPWPKSTAPWQRVHVDFAGPIEGDYYLLAIDSFSKWPEIIRTTRITSAATISILRGLFARLGMPVNLVSDNGTQFTSAEFADFCASNGIEHLTTAPFHPQSNGQAERFVDTFKRAVKKIREGRGSIEEALDVFLLTYRSTPSRALPDQKSPSEIMFGRKIRTCLELLRPPPVRVPVPTDDDRKQPRSFNRNETVYAKLHGRTGWKWAPGVVVEKIGDVMYNVWVEDRRMLRSHINQLRSRLAAGAIPKQPTVHATLNQHSLPLDILLDAWDLPSQSPGPSSPEPVSSAERTMVGSGPTLATSTPRHEVSAFVPSSASSLSTTTTPTSTEFESAVEVELAVDIPRRSSRLRRPPVRFDPYHLY
ncbi:uncharacterized protein K02A2.6-like [Toxorhynchites rutilus septentrionalis]|uniref:uncharacterized protein K02A2.6-like n=1 Tax=Toxorhynchites rutilus septentrionalis TaxID=329112 RepID=UPI002479A46C|nr:uncharacterized protein K02A2.6-like [Toxorhynchites rutilus septentrionalis]